MTITRYPAAVPELDLEGPAWARLLPVAAELAKTVAGTEFVPKGLRNNVPAITAAVMYGAEVGLGPMQSLAKIAVIDGRPALAAEAQRALILAAGHELWLPESTITRAVWAGRRAGSDVVTEVAWTLDDARRANLAGKPNWRTYPRAMLSARASAELARAVFPDIIGGLMALEELEEPDAAASGGANALAPGTADVGDGRGVGTTRRRGRPKSKPVTATASAPPPRVETPELEVPPLPGEEGVELMGSAQRRRMMAGFSALGLGGNKAPDREKRLAYVLDTVNHPVESSNELTADEANKVITRLETGAAMIETDTGEPANAGEPAPGAATDTDPTGSQPVTGGVGDPQPQPSLDLEDEPG